VFDESQAKTRAVLRGQASSGDVQRLPGDERLAAISQIAKTELSARSSKRFPLNPEVAMQAALIRDGALS
jgi:hypothetical protein